MPNYVDFKSLVGSKAKFYGVESERFKLGKVVFEVEEDPCDGYRSMLAGVSIVDNATITGGNGLLANVIIATDDDIEGYKLIDADTGHTWLRFGTSDHNDYYPCFLFSYTPYEGDSFTSPERLDDLTERINEDD